MSENEWHCEAYGPELDRLRPEHGRHCFWENIDPCQVKVQCRVRLDHERRRVYDRLLELAAAGEGYAHTILEDVAGPEDLLNATEDPDVDRASTTDAPESATARGESAPD